MDKLKMHTPDFTDENIKKLAELFPNCVTESLDEDGKLKKAIAFDQLRQELSTSVVDGPRERYQLNWPGKREALLAANAPIAKTLRPCREESVDFDTTQNLFIEGDNLDALKLLQETYLNKVKMIYIDPPYNTGNDFVYDDDFTEDTETYFQRSNQKDEVGNRMVANTEANGRFHSDWLSMMYPRLKLARNLLREDGVIFISIDDGEQANVKRICDEIFGETNFVASIVWQKRTAPDSRANLSPGHDYLLVYARSVDFARPTLNKLPLKESRKASYKNPDNDPRGPWSSENLTGQTGHATPSQFYKIKTPTGTVYDPPEGRCWALAESTFLKLQTDGRIWFGASGNNRPRLKRFLSESDGMMAWTWWPNDEVGHNQEATKEAKELLGAGDVFNNPKPTRLISRMLNLATGKSDIILDFFSGACTTAHAVMQLNAKDGGKRKFIMVQLDEPCDEKSEAFKAGYKTIAEIGKERIRRAGKKIKDELGSMKYEEQTKILDDKTHTSSLILHNLDTGFRVLKVDSSNMKDVYYSPDAVKQDDLFDYAGNIREDRTSEDLLFQVLLDWGVDLSLSITQETIGGKAVFFVDENALAACFESDISEEMVKELAARKPLRAVFRDSGFVSDSVKINVEQIFKLISPGTEVKVI
ncbi:MAG: site-specific DNA-methyltransferase [Nitrospirae bacterium]|nr:site-specific DNA-methyltransferase [Nitrospirota bacterium]